MRKQSVILTGLLFGIVCLLPNQVVMAANEKEPESWLIPKKAAYGYYVEEYQKNNSENQTPETNPSIGVLSQFLQVFTPGTTWNDGVIKNPKVQEQNLRVTAGIARNRTKEMEQKAYLDDRRDPRYNVLTGLGSYYEAFQKGTNAGTTIPDSIPEDATHIVYMEQGNANGRWADLDTKYGAVVGLVDQLQEVGASTAEAKQYYKYMRPFRWSDAIQVEAWLQPRTRIDPSLDFGFPSGHTNAAYLAALGLAYAMPERFEELLTRASELGNNRIVAGMHSCLDVMGGRVLGTATAAAALNDPRNKETKEAAYETARSLGNEELIGEEEGDDKREKELYRERLTYGMQQTGDIMEPMVVPKGAEVLLETRFPYLDAQQRRAVLYTTGIASGYPVLDDAEGWGRLNLFEAAGGYGAFVTDVRVDLNGEKGGFCAFDEWKNDIGGAGALIKGGTGTLALSGNNRYRGGTVIKEGTMTALSADAFGMGTVTNYGKVTENVAERVHVQGDYVQTDNAVLELTIASEQDGMTIEGSAILGGTLVLHVSNGYVPKEPVKVISYKEGARKGAFTAMIFPEWSNAKVRYEEDGIWLCKY